MALVSRFVGFLLVTITGLLTPSAAYKHYVGGRDGWVLKPSEDYNHWAERNRFQVNDTIYFKGNDSVLVVTKDAYNSCNDMNPIQRLDMGDTTFTLNRSGPFFFISGNVDHCQKGQKLIVVVLAVRHKQSSPPPPSPVPPSTPPASSSPEAPSPRVLPPVPTSGQNSNGTNATAPPGNSSASTSLISLVLAAVSLILSLWFVN